MNKFNVFLVIVYTFTPVIGLEIVNPGTKFLHTKGEVWPKPTYQYSYNMEYVYDHENFKFVPQTESCTLLNSAIARTQAILDNMNKLLNKHSGPVVGRRELFLNTDLLKTNFKPKGREFDVKYLKELKIVMKGTCNDKVMPDEDMDESYSLVLTDERTLESKSIWGAIRGLETFSQLIFISGDESSLRIHMVIIRDSPAYSHRGLMLDTSRHFISVPNILSIIEAMEYNKMNVFHWHLTDDPSFPLVTPNKELNHAAYHPSAHYTEQDITKIILHARERGIRVIPELSIPTHASSWAAVVPGVITICPNGTLGPMNVMSEGTYNLITSIMRVIAKLFTDKYVHIGVRNVNFDCWSEDKNLLELMALSKVKTEDILALFIEKVMDIFRRGATLMMYQEVADFQIFAGLTTVIQMWKTSDMEPILCQGYRVVYSTCWQLDHDDWTDGGWEDFYYCNPRAKVDTLHDSIIGGEAFVRTEFIDDTNVMTRIWPRASAVAERLWSNPDANATLPYNRMEEHACRMIRRGIAVQPPNGPGFCYH